MEGPEYCDVEVENGRVMLTPALIQQADAVRAKLAVLFMQAIELEAQLEMTGKNSCLRFIKNGLE